MTSPSPEELPRLGRYQVLNKLAQGGMAEIYVAKAIGVMGFEKLVAVKLIHKHLTRDSEFVKMFIDEARIAMHLHHRNIVQVLDLDKLDDTYFIAMEYVHGVNLYDVYERIASKGRWIDLPLALYIVSEVCKGLHFAHTRTGSDGRPLNIVHRDISPQNVLMSFEGEVKITDFGIAKAAERLHQTTPGIVKGKYAYMAPEVLKERPPDARVDVFACGVLLYELLVGENPFAGQTPVDTIENVLHLEVPAPSARGALVQRELDEIVLHALAKDPDERYQSAHELSEVLTEYGLNLTRARRDIAAGDVTVASLLAELFPEKAKSAPKAAAPGSLDLPIAGGDGGATARPKIELTQTRSELLRKSDNESSTELDLVSDDPTEGMRVPEVLPPAPPITEPSEDLVRPVESSEPPRTIADQLASMSHEELAQHLSADQLQALRKLSAPTPAPATPAPTPPSGRSGLLGAVFGVIALVVVLAVVGASRLGGKTLVEVPITSEPSGASVTINGLTEANRTPLTAKLVVGESHDIELALPGHLSFKKQIRPISDVQVSLHAELRKSRGSIEVRSSPPDAEVFIDGRSRGKGNVLVDGLELGKSIEVRVVKDGLKPYESAVSLSEDGATKVLDVVLQR